MTRTLVRRATLSGAALLAGAVLSACGSSDHGSMPGMGNAGGSVASSSASAAADDADVRFAQHMIPHHQQAVAMAGLAETRASDAEVKKLAGQIKAAQDPEIATMTGWLTAWGKPMTMPSTEHGMDMGDASMPGMMSDAEMSALSQATGKEFDKEFLHMMITHHQGAITMAQEEVADGTKPEVIALAKQIITAQEAEIATMKEMLARL